jgi:hypothetical protein
VQQLALFERDRQIVSRPDAQDAAIESRRVDPSPTAQPGLFDEDTQQRTALSRALSAGAFDEALDLVDWLADSGSQSTGQESPRQHVCLARDVLAGGSLERAAHHLSALSRTDLANPWLSEACAGFVRVAVARHGADRLAAAADARGLALLVNIVAAMADDGFGPQAARNLLRDALLQEASLDADDFDDAAVRDLLGEHGHPVWLASLGALRGLWQVARPTESQVQAIDVEAVVPAAEAARAREFWLCYGATRWDRRSGVVHAARRRMKALNPALHAMRYA